MVENKTEIGVKTKTPKLGIEGLWTRIETLHRQIRETGDVSFRSKYIELLTTYGQAYTTDMKELAGFLKEIEEVLENIELVEEIGGEAFEESLSRYELLEDKLWALGIEV